MWFDKNMSWFTAASGTRGRSPTFSDAAIQFCLTIKNLFGLALRQASSGSVTAELIRPALARAWRLHPVQVVTGPVNAQGP